MAWLLIAAAVLLRAAVPVGWMPVAHAEGVRVLLCTGNGPTVIQLDLASSADKDASQPGPMRDPCPFGLALAMAADLPPPPAETLPPQAREAMLAPALLEARLAAWRALRPPARGPPSFA